MSDRAPADAAGLADTLLGWGESTLRDLPWRRTRDPWAVLLAETMLQQTQVARVVDRWDRFLERFPTPRATAEAPPADLLREWAGLGYNRRALMLHGAATAITRDHDGVVPDDLAALLALPGVGPYTARAVLAFAHESPAAPVDTNIGRVLARLGGASLTTAEAQRRADELVATGAVWLWNQSLMELGATVCTKRSPRCEQCPLQAWCSWRSRGADPAEGSAGVSRPQSRFEGSDRQLRGRLVDALCDGPIGVAAAGVLADVPADRRVRVIEGLVADGLVEDGGDVLRLAGDLRPVRSDWR